MNLTLFWVQLTIIVKKFAKNVWLILSSIFFYWFFLIGNCWTLAKFFFFIREDSLQKLMNITMIIFFAMMITLVIGLWIWIKLNSLIWNNRLICLLTFRLKAIVVKRHIIVMWRIVWRHELSIHVWWINMRRIAHHHLLLLWLPFHISTPIKASSLLILSWWSSTAYSNIRLIHLFCIAKISAFEDCFLI